MQKIGPYPATATAHHFVIGEGDAREVIGILYTILTTGGRTFWVAEGHDFDADADEQAKGFVPLHLGVFQDPAEAEDLIERRAREAYAPDTLPGERPATHVFADAIDDVTGEPTASVSRPTADRLEARVPAENVTAALALTATLKRALPYASVRQTGAAVALWTTEADLRKALRR